MASVVANEACLVVITERLLSGGNQVAQEYVGICVMPGMCMCIYMLYVDMYIIHRPLRGLHFP